MALGRPEQRTYSIDVVAKMMGVSRSSAYTAARRGELPSIKIGRRIVCPKVAIDRMLIPEPADNQAQTANE